jgi:hypothetical protein
MTRLNVTVPIRSKALYNALLAEEKFKKVWVSLSNEEKKIYLKAQGFNETMPYAIDQFLGHPKIKEIDDAPSMPVIETKPNKIDQFQGKPRIKEFEGVPEEVKQVEVVERVNPENFHPDEMRNILDLLVNRPLTDPLPTVAFIDKLKKSADKLGNTLKKTPAVLNNHVNKFSENTKKAASEWHAKSPQEKINHAAQHVSGAVKRITHHAVHHAKHEYHTYKGASKALHHIATGKKWKDLHHEHKTALKHAIVHAGITAGSLALGDASGGGVGHLLGNFAAEHAHHALTLGAGKVAYKSAKDAYNKATSSKEKLSTFQMEEEAKKIIKLLIDADIPEEEWAEILHRIETEIKKDTKKK